MKHPESIEQQCLIAWATASAAKYPELSMLYSIPNGASLAGGKIKRAIQGRRLKAEGMKPGVLDLCLPVARHGFHSLYIEMKAPGKIATLSEAQLQWIIWLREEGHKVEVYDNWTDASKELARYLTPAGR